MGYDSGNSYTPYYRYLAHSGKGHDDNPPGRGSGRYPYGSGKRPFQRGGGLFGRRKRKKELKRQQQKEEIARKLREQREKELKKNFENEAAKIATLTDTTATELLMYRDNLTNKELRDSLDRIKMTRELRDISRKEENEGWEAVNSAMRKLGYVNDWARTGKNTYQIVEDIIDTLDKTSKKMRGK